MFSQDDSADLVGSVSELGFSRSGDGHCGCEYSGNVNPDRKTTGFFFLQADIQNPTICEGVNECVWGASVSGHFKGAFVLTESQNSVNVTF